MDTADDVMNELNKYQVLTLVCLLVMACSSEDGPTATTGEAPVATDISVTAAVDVINWTTMEDLVQQVNAAIVFNNGRAQESELVKTVEIASDNSEATGMIAFTDAAASSYRDLNVTNNSVTILLVEGGSGRGATVLTADGPGDTYSLISSVLSPGSDPVEVPDCGHTEFGEHIDEIFDEELGANVFRFILHTDSDDDRCQRQDRQRNEIKTFSPSPDFLLGIEGETVEYKWMFKMDEGFQGSRNFTHFHQLKSVGDVNVAVPMITFTARGSSNMMELRYAELDRQVTVHEESLDLFRGNWVEVIEQVTYINPGNYEVTMSYLDGTTIFEYSDDQINAWRDGADFIRPKWGIYRSLENAQDLRDEFVLYNNFSIEEL